MIRRRPLLFWLLLAAALGAAAWWVLYTPYRPEHMYRALPAQTAFVSVHRDLAGRWDTIHRNPLIQTLFLAFGVKPEELNELSADPVARQWLQQLASDEALVAYVPSLGTPGEPAWIIVTWLGAKSQRLRWNLRWAKIRELTAHPPYRGWPSWTLDTGGEDEPKLTFALVEGMGVGVFSSDPRLLNEALDALDGVQPSLEDQPDFPGRTGIWCRDPKAPDRGWVNPAAVSGGVTSPVGAVSYEWSELQSGGLRGCVTGRDPFAVEFSRAPRLKAGGLDRLLGDLPQGLALLSPSLVLPYMEQPKRAAWMRLMAEIIRLEKAGVVALALLGDDYSGRLKGIKLPTLVGALPVGKSELVSAWLREALDRLNARYRWGLVPREVAAGRGRMTIIEATSTNFLAGLPPSECPAYMLRDGWLLLASNSEGLEKLADRFDALPTNRPPPVSWMRDLDNEPAPVYVWLDLARAGKTLRMALSTYSLKLLLEDPGGSQETRQKLNEAKAWVDSLMPLSRARFWMRSDGTRMEVSYKLGGER
ncbi:MAG TPA: hypothetical protein P5567_01465 [Kiritimatiellia bacterium]|nr:hypothetical protein [Kiritimatiellia bacterium]HRZ11104.1 hypothetical protein [Kiritimatiellia bacterium]HSA19524.1 hypothetical protein [Kiritimatiellia bacterium]